MDQTIICSVKGVAACSDELADSTEPSSKEFLGPFSSVLCGFMPTGSALI